MDILLKEAAQFESAKMSHMSTSDRVMASREAKRLVLAINEIYKKTQDASLMDMMKKITVKNQKIDKLLKGNLSI